MGTIHKTMEEILNTPPTDLEIQVENLLKRHAVKFTLADEEVVVPLYDNLDSHKIYWWDSVEETPEDILQDCFEQLEAKWTSEKWGYYEKVYDMELIPVPEYIKDSNDTTECNEFWNLYCYTELMIEPELYSRPFDNSPDGSLYSCYFAVDCMKGNIYSKDFAYSECDCCGRTICNQNPSNGWVAQFRNLDDGGGMICLKCLEEDLMANGVDIDEMLRTKSISKGMFFNSGELEDAGFDVIKGYDGICVGHGYKGYSDPDNLFNRIADDIALFKDKIVIIEYDTMAIGGMGGYVTFWSKEKSVTNVG